jgi:acyl-CoA dehydrogenase
MDFLLNEDNKAIQDLARQFTKNEIIPKAAHHDATMEYPRDIVNKAHAAGLLNVSVPEKWGGLGLGHLNQVLIQEQFSYGCTGITTAITANDLALGPLLIAGNDAQLEEFAAPMTREPILAAYCVTEPGAGSDVQGIRTQVKRDGDHYILNGSKMWITNAGVAGWYYVLATMDPAKGHKAMVALIVPTNLPGIQIGKKEINVGQRCSDTRGITFDNVKVPVKYRLGEEGEGFKIAMKAFDYSRPGVAAGALGLSQRCLDESVRYAMERKTFGKPIADHQAIQFIIADMAKDIELARLVTYKSAAEIDAGRRNTKYASIAKCFAGDMAVRIASDAVQVFGGYGYNTEYPVEKLYRDAKIYQIYEGTQQIQRLIIARHVFEEYA